MQITEPALADWNTHQRTALTMDDMFDPALNQTVGTWYFNERIPQMLKHYKLQDTTENRLWAYNAGIGNLVKGIKPQETKDYIAAILKAMHTP